MSIPLFVALRRYAALFLFMTALSACTSAPRELYYWGNYENMIYQMYLKPGSATPEVQIERLTQDIQRAEARGQKIAPGLFAHLGVMYAAAGNLASAEVAFNEEKMRFPESAVLIDGMLERAKKNFAKDNKGNTL